MLIEDLTTIDNFINEKQIQPAQGKTEGNILVLGGSPGSGKNWVISNLTDVKSRYKIFDVDTILELAARMDAPKIKKSFSNYINQMDDAVMKKEMLDHLGQYGIMGFLKDYTNHVYQDVLRDFLHDSGILQGSKDSFILSTLYGNKPNIALNGTLRRVDTVVNDLVLFSEVGYEVEKNVDFLFVLNTEEEAISNATKREKTTRKVDNRFLIDARDGMIKNLLDLLSGNSPLSEYTRNIYIVFNTKEDISYYPDSSLVKDFRYVKLTLNDTDKIKKITSMINNDYA